MPPGRRAHDSPGNLRRQSFWVPWRTSAAWGAAHSWTPSCLEQAASALSLCGQL